MQETNLLSKPMSRWENAKVNASVTLLFGIFFGVPGLLLWSVTPNSIKYPLLYSVIYQTHAANVHFEKMPPDCDWSRSPLGDKGCHYKKGDGSCKG